MDVKVVGIYSSFQVYCSRSSKKQIIPPFSRDIRFWRFLRTLFLRLKNDKVNHLLLKFLIFLFEKRNFLFNAQNWRLQGHEVTLDSFWQMPKCIDYVTNCKQRKQGLVLTMHLVWYMMYDLWTMYIWSMFHWSSLQEQLHSFYTFCERSQMVRVEKTLATISWSKRKDAHNHAITTPTWPGFSGGSPRFMQWPWNIHNFFQVSDH